MPKMSGYVKKFKVKEEDKDKNKNYCLSVQMMRSYQKCKKLFGLRLKT